MIDKKCIVNKNKKSHLSIWKKIFFASFLILGFFLSIQKVSSQTTTFAVENDYNSSSAKSAYNASASINFSKLNTYYNAFYVYGVYISLYEEGNAYHNHKIHVRLLRGSYRLNNSDVLAKQSVRIGDLGAIGSYQNPSLVYFNLQKPIFVTKENITYINVEIENYGSGFNQLYWLGTSDNSSDGDGVDESDVYISKKIGGSKSIWERRNYDLVFSLSVEDSKFNDMVAPTYRYLKAHPIIKGDVQNISIEVYDFDYSTRLSTVDVVKLKIGGNNYTMNKGKTTLGNYEVYWFPWYGENVGKYNFEIFMVDVAGNCKNISGSFDVVVYDPTLEISSVYSNVIVNSITIRWTTNRPTRSRIYYGLENNPNNSFDPYTECLYDSELTTNHQLVLSNLLYGRSYHYMIASVDSGYYYSNTTDNTFFTSRLHTGHLSYPGMISRSPSLPKTIFVYYTDESGNPVLGATVEYVLRSVFGDVYGEGKMQDGDGDGNYTASVSGVPDGEPLVLEVEAHKEGNYVGKSQFVLSPKEEEEESFFEKYLTLFALLGIIPAALVGSFYFKREFLDKKNRKFKNPFKKLKGAFKKLASPFKKLKNLFGRNKTDIDDLGKVETKSDSPDIEKLFEVEDGVENPYSQFEKGVDQKSAKQRVEDEA